MGRTLRSTSNLARVSPMFLLLAALYLLVLASRFLLVENYSTDIPFFDQWMTEAPLLQKVVYGQFVLRDLWAPVFEHRIVWSRILQVGTFLLNNGLWDAQVEMTVNAFFLSAVPVVLLLALQPCKPGTGGHAPPHALAHYALIGVVSFIWLSQVLWYNAVWAFQFHISLLPLFSLVGIALVLKSNAFSTRWWLGMVFLAAAVIAAGSGFLAAASVAGAMLLHLWHSSNWRLDRRQLATLVASFLVVALGIVIRVADPEEGIPTKAESLGDFSLALLKNLSWPWTSDLPGSSLIPVSGAHIGNPIYPLALVLWLPAPIFMILLLFRGSWRGKRLDSALGDWGALAAIIIWAYVQIIYLAYVRGGDGRPPSWRHYDIHAIGAVVNFAALFRLHPLLASLPASRFRLPPARATSLAIIIACGMLAAHVAGILEMSTRASAWIAERQIQNNAQQNNLRNYLATRDPLALRGKPLFHIPFVDDALLRTYLDDPRMQSALPPSLRAPLPLTAVGQGIRQNSSPPFISPPPQRKLWSTWLPQEEATSPNPTASNATGSFLVAPPSTYPYLVVPFIGEFKPDAMPEITARPAQSGSKELPVAMGKFHWRDWNEAVIKLDHRSPSPTAIFAGPTALPRQWIALLEPIEIGQLTYWTRKLRDAAFWIAAAGVFLLLLGIAKLLPRPVDVADP